MNQNTNKLQQSEVEMILDKVTKEMHEIEVINAVYNKATNFGQFPNGQEAYIEHQLKVWDNLKCRRERVKSWVL